jgi:hypothetical protein
MIRQSKKTDKELYKWYLDLIGVNPNSYRLDDTYGNRIFQRLLVNTKETQNCIVNKINNFDGICYILVEFDGNERVEDNVFMEHLVVYWDSSKQAKRIKRLYKVKSRAECFSQTQH